MHAWMQKKKINLYMHPYSGPKGRKRSSRAIIQEGSISTRGNIPWK